MNVVQLKKNQLLSENNANFLTFLIKKYYTNKRRTIQNKIFAETSNTTIRKKYVCTGKTEFLVKYI